LAQRLSELHQIGLLVLIVCRRNDADASHPVGVLRARSKRPDCRRSTQNTKKIAPSHIAPARRRLL